MVLRAGAAESQQLKYMQLGLADTRVKTRVKQQDLARYLGVVDRSLRDWEKAYDSPSTPHLIGWAGALGYRFILVEADVDPEALPPVCLCDGETWVLHEIRRLIAVLRTNRQARRWSQTDLALLLRVSRASVQRWEDREKWPRPLPLLVWAGRLDYRLTLIRDGSPLLEQGAQSQLLRTQQE